MDFKKELSECLSKQINESITIEAPPNPTFGDYALPCFKLSKNPEVLRKLLKLPRFIEKTEIKGSYLNFFIKKEYLAKTTIENILKNKHLAIKKEKKRIVIEYPSPNTNKPLHLGHIRNIVFGQSVVNLLKLIGNNVIQVNLLNDRGIHICKSMLAYQKYGNNKLPDKKPDHFVGDFYVLFQKEAEKNQNLEQEALEILNKWEKGDKATIKLWKKMNSWAIAGFNTTLKEFDTSFKKTYKESEIYKKGSKIVKKGLEDGKFKRDESNAIVAELEQYGLPNKVLLRSDGTSIYITQDIALAWEKYKDFKMDSSIIVAASEQNLHFKQLSKILEILGYNFNNEHLTYGMVYLPEGRMKSREGKVVDADDLLQEIISMTKKEILKRYNNLSEKEINNRSKKIALAAIRFYLLKVDPTKDITYNPEESISFEGETGPYIQYTYARIQSVLKKEKARLKPKYHLLTHPIEINIITQLNKFNAVLAEAIKYKRPSTIANFVLKLAQFYNEFYHSCPILKAERNLKDSRLILSKATALILKQCLNLLCIKTLNAM